MRKVLFIIWNALILCLSLYGVYHFRPNFSDDNGFLLYQDVTVTFIFLPAVFILTVGFPTVFMFKVRGNPWVKFTIVAAILVVLILVVYAALPYSIVGKLILCSISLMYSFVYIIVAFALSVKSVELARQGD